MLKRGTNATRLLRWLRNCYEVTRLTAFSTENTRAINVIYYLVSLSWLLCRACSVVLAAADVSLHSKRALSTLNLCPNSSFNIEIKRLTHQLSYDNVALSGKGFFYLHREILLEVAAAVLKYELILIQYDK